MKLPHKQNSKLGKTTSRRLRSFRAKKAAEKKAVAEARLQAEKKVNEEIAKKSSREESCRGCRKG